MEEKEQTFRGRAFKVVKGDTHPEYSFFTFEKEEINFRDQYWGVNSGDIVFDIGSSYGTYTLSALVMGATVYTFEPEQTVFVGLMNNLKLNNWKAPFYAYNYGLWDSESSVDMKSYAPHWPQQSISSDYSMKTLDQVAEESNLIKLDWMKIDVEGAEERVVRGGLKTIAKFKPNLIVECHSFLDADIKDRVKTLLSSVCDYEFEEVDRPPCVMLCATPKER